MDHVHCAAADGCGVEREGGYHEALYQPRACRYWARRQWALRCYRDVGRAASRILLFLLEFCQKWTMFTVQLLMAAALSEKADIMSLYINPGHVDIGLVDSGHCVVIELYQKW